MAVFGLINFDGDKRKTRNATGLTEENLRIMSACFDEIKQGV